MMQKKKRKMKKKHEEAKKKQEEENKKALTDARKKAEDEKRKADEEKHNAGDDAEKEAEDGERGEKEGAEKYMPEGKIQVGDENESAETDKNKEEADADMGKQDEGDVEMDKNREEAKEEGKEEEKEEEAEEEEDTQPPVVELTEEEERIWFLTHSIPDLSAQVINQVFGQFTIPDKSEGFDDIRFEWQNENKSKDYLQKWVLEKKLTSRIEDLQPSEWFKNKHAEWTKILEEWKGKHKPFQYGKDTSKNDKKKLTSRIEDLQP